MANMRTRHSFRRPLRLLFVLALFFSWSGAWPALRARAAADADDQRLAERRTRLLDTLQRVADVAEADLAKPGADPSDVPGRAAELGGDAGKIFAFVRDEIAFEPYRGVLRGAGGTLACRAGNSADKSVLLKAMLEAAGHRCRLVHGQIPAEKSAALVEQFRKADSAKSPLASFGTPSGDMAKSVAEYAERAGIDAKAVAEWTSDSIRDAQRLEAETAELTAREFEYLGSQIEKAGIKLGRPQADATAELAARVGEHVWVQLAGDGGAWQNLDPSFSDAQPGGPDPAPPTELDPAKLERHAVDFKLTYHLETDGKPEEHVLIEQPIYADRALTDFPQFRIMPADPSPPPEQMAKMTPEQMVQQFRSIKKYQPVLALGRQVFAAEAFDLEGNFYAVGGDGRLKAASEIAGAQGKAFGGALGGFGGGGGDAKPSRKFVRLDVLLTVRIPGAEPRTQQRVLLTAEQTKGDHFLSPMVVWEILVQGQPVSAEWVSYRSLRHQLELWKPALQVMRDPKAGPAEVARFAASKFEPFPALVLEFAQFRQGEMGRQLRANPGLAFLFDAPQVVISEQRFCARVASREMCGKRRIDIVDNAVHVVARDNASAPAAAQAAMRQGVFDTVAEATLLQRATKSAPESSIVATERSRAGGAKLIAAAPSDLGAVPVAALGVTDRQWIAAYEPPARRVLVVTPPSAPQAPTDANASAETAEAAWWSLDPLTGATLGRSSGGRGAALTEYQMTNVTYYACLTTTVYDMGRNASKQNWTLNGKQATKYILQSLGCFALFMGGMFLSQGKAAVQVGQVLFTVIMGMLGTEVDVS
jgi:transglutaminase-like putative cysteine protease